jgi:hypothetical protein
VADRYAFDLNAEHPNVDINTMRLALLQAIADVRANAGGVDDSYFLTDLLFSLLDSALSAVDALAARVTALEPPPVIPPPLEEPL